MTDAIKAVVENTGRLTREGVVMKVRYIDFINNVPNEDKKESDKKRAKGIIARIKSKLTELGKEDA